MGLISERMEECDEAEKKDSYAVFLECVLRDDDVLFGDMKN